jgi:hypothetical protein
MLDGKQIREVTAQGVRYIDENNIEQFIDFAQCNRNYINERLSPENWKWHKEWNHKTDLDWDDYVEGIKSHKKVGARNVFADKPFIEFYTQPRLTFEFGTRAECDQILYLIKRAKYYTTDLT